MKAFLNTIKLGLGYFYA